MIFKCYQYVYSWINVKRNLRKYFFVSTVDKNQVIINNWSKAYNKWAN
jgi:hypothetical protein